MYIHSNETNLNDGYAFVHLSLKSLSRTAISLFASSYTMYTYIGFAIILCSVLCMNVHFFNL